MRRADWLENGVRLVDSQPAFFNDGAALPARLRDELDEIEVVNKIIRKGEVSPVIPAGRYSRDARADLTTQRS